MEILLCICHDFPPKLVPTAIKIDGLLEYLHKDWRIHVVTSVKNGFIEKPVSVHFVKSWVPNVLFRGLCKLKLHKLIGLFVWPDEAVFWILPAVFRAKRLIKKYKPKAILVFMMPYSAGLAGIILKWLTGLPLILNFDDSYTCTDMHPFFPTQIHYKISIWLEDFYVKCSDAVVYVSKRNLEAVRNRHPKDRQAKFYLVRFGVEPKYFSRKDVNKITLDDTFRVIYTGGMTGWLDFYNPINYVSLRKIIKAWNKLWVYELVRRDSSTHSPIFIGRAVKQVITQNPEWKGKIRIDIYETTNPPQRIIDNILENEGLRDVVNVHSGLSHPEAIRLICQADLLFLCLCGHPASSPSRRISSKTFEYLMTEKPILGALPKGENWEYLEDKPGVWLVEPTDVSGMAKVVKELAAAKFFGKPITFERSHIQNQLSYENRAKEFTRIIYKVLEVKSNN